MINFQPQKDTLSVPGPQGFGSPNDLPTAQGGDLEGEHELEGHQPMDQQPQSEEHVVNIPEQLITDPEAPEDSLFSEQMSNYSGWLSFLESFILGPNQGNPIWRLRVLSGISLYIATVVGFRFYLPPEMAMPIMNVGAPIVVAAFGLFVPNRHTNWITGLSVANFILLCGHLANYWAQKWGTGS